MPTSTPMFTPIASLINCNSSRDSTLSSSSHYAVLFSHRWPASHRWLYIYIYIYIHTYISLQYLVNTFWLPAVSCYQQSSGQPLRRGSWVLNLQIMRTWSTTSSGNWSRKRHPTDAAPDAATSAWVRNWLYRQQTHHPCSTKGQRLSQHADKGPYFALHNFREPSYKCLKTNHMLGAIGISYISETQIYYAPISIPHILFWHCDHHSLVSTVGLAGFSSHYSYLRCAFACEVWWISRAFHAGLCSFQCICPINLTFKTLLSILHLTSINIAISHYKLKYPS